MSEAEDDIDDAIVAKVSDYVDGLLTGAERALPFFERSHFGLDLLFGGALFPTQGLTQRAFLRVAFAGTLTRHLAVDTA